VKVLDTFSTNFSVGKLQLPAPLPSQRFNPRRRWHRCQMLLYNPVTYVAKTFIASDSANWQTLWALQIYIL